MYDLDPAPARGAPARSATPLRSLMPSRASASSTMAAHSGSSLGKRRRRFEHRDLGAEPAKRLRQFEADRAGADDDEMARAIGEIEHGFGGEMRRVGKPGIGGSAGDEPVAMTKRRAVMVNVADRDGAGILETARRRR